MIRLRRHPGERAFTLVELMISAAIVLMVGAIVYFFFNAGLVLFSKTVSVTSVEAEARSVTNRIQQELNRAIERPVLLQGDGSPTNALGGLGIRFRVLPQLQEGDPIPTLGQRQNLNNFEQVAFLVEDRRTLNFYPNWQSANNRGNAVQITNGLVAPATSDEASHLYPFHHTSTPANPNALELNLKFLARQYGARLSRQFQMMDRYMQNPNTFFQLRSIVTLKNKDLF